jgi:tetratricopeptide (TPR) repeat protein
MNPMAYQVTRSGPFGTVLLCLCLGFSFPTVAQEIELSGKWACKLGVIRLHQKNKKVTGKLIWANQKTCPFKRGDQVLKGVLLEDSLSGQWRYCLKGDECRGDKWAPVVMLVARAGKVLSGAAHFKATECGIGGKGRGDGVVVRKLRRKPKPPPKPPEPKDAGAEVAKAAEKPGLVDEDGQPLEEEVQPPDPGKYEKNAGTWRENMEQAVVHMSSGFFERARKNFKVATQLDPTRPEAFSGIGVTYYARGDYEEALRWYKQALEVDPNFGDAYYNMACIYSLLKKKALAFRYLQIATLNGYAEYQAMETDEDLNNLRGDKRYKEILKKMRKK